MKNTGKIKDENFSLIQILIILIMYFENHFLFFSLLLNHSNNEKMDKINFVYANETDYNYSNDRKMVKNSFISQAMRQAPYI